MGINWFTVVAQIINFLILVWLLKRFLYKPVLQAIAERENRIAAQLRDAEAKKAEAEQEKEDFAQKNLAFDQQREAAMKKALADVSAEKQHLLAQAREELATTRTKLEESLREEQQHISRELRQKTVDEVFALAGKALSDLASASLEEQTLAVFLRRLQNLTPEEQQKLAQAVATPKASVTIKTAFDLPAKQRTQLEEAVKQLGGDHLSFVYQTAPQLLGGLELVVPNYKLSWNLADYLEDLKKHVTDAVTDPQNATAHESV